ncbi:NAD(P)-dependent oxidoreductase [Halobacteriovorax sp. JY17]|uniref:NAD-dependent epimerase/dehydratase family protein n=1 Tax=Halobacteriovorax sp. JY17 TaxID=2014617 RepID=UPI000C424F24|nr:NAD(P)-dependent oxidoreductase [Halobacteriovorax sp. JY17]PIK14698.1 MAG: hypothetical protein CES88_10190 [Halobacteriovorax sp. JY17]
MSLNSLKIADSDLEEIYLKSKEWFSLLEGRTIFLTGGTGFFGKWIIYSIIYANQFLKEKITILSITRNIEKLKENSPDIVADPSVKFFEGNLESLKEFNQPADIFIHCAANVITSSCTDKESYQDLELRNTHAVLKFCKENKIKRIVYTSSGAVYGACSSLDPNIDEVFHPNSELTPYGSAKRESEEIIRNFCLKENIEFNIARCFAFLGGYIPLEGSFAAGNFIRNMLKSEEIIVNSDGQAIRSFMYMTDLCNSILNLSTNPTMNQTVNIGSSENINIESLAREIAKYNPKTSVNIKVKNKSEYFNKYAPNTDKAKDLFGIEASVDFNDAIKRTIEFYKGSKH